MYFLKIGKCGIDSGNGREMKLTKPGQAFDKRGSWLASVVLIGHRYATTDSLMALGEANLVT